jgi:hypothetical protein
VPTSVICPPDIWSERNRTILEEKDIIMAHLLINKRISIALTSVKTNLPIILLRKAGGGGRPSGRPSNFH